MYADDISQIITTESKSKHMMKRKVEREIERINRFEKSWKIKTSEEKFQIIPLAQLKTQPIVINGRNINTCKEGKLLGLKIQRTGIVGHATDRIHKGRAIIGKLKRFSQLTPKLKATLVKTLLIPVLEYPPIPLCSLSKTQKINMQVILNKGINFINCNNQEFLSIKETHEMHNIKPFNLSTYKKSLKIWETIKHTNEQQYDDLIAPRPNKHNWFPKSSNILTAPPPLPLYTSDT